MGLEIINLTGNPNVTTKTNILDIPIPWQLRKIQPTGIQEIDFMFSTTGLTPSVVTLVTGSPGYGKTTLMLQLANSLTEQGVVSVYSTTEESLFQVAKTVERLGLKAGFHPCYCSEVHELLEYLKKIEEDNPGKKIALFVDSLQSLEYEEEDRGRGRPLGRLNGQVQTICLLSAWAKRTFNFVFIIGQVTKAGVFAGKQECKHAIDAHLELNLEKDKDSELFGEKVLRLSKNRFGPSGFAFPYILDASGFQINRTKES